MKSQILIVLTCLCVIMGLTAGAQAHAQIRFTWFDTNPDRSNTDANNPNGSSGGRVQHLGASANGGRTYGASEWGGLYASFNQGLTWDRVNELAPSATWDVKVDPGNAERIYVTSLYDGRVNSRAGISISNDGGRTWNNAPVSALNCAVATRVNEPSAFQIAIRPNSNRTVFVGTNCGLARTFDSGANWDYVDPSGGLIAERIFAVIAHDTATIDVVGDNGFFRSTDNGATWGAAPAAPLASPVTTSLAVAPQENNALFRSFIFFNAAGNLQTSLVLSADGGTSWPTTVTLPANNAQGRIPFVKTNQRTASNQYDVYYGDISLFNVTFNTPTSAPAGNFAPTWNNIQTGAHNDVADIIFTPGVGADACPFLFANDGGIYRNTRTGRTTCHDSPNWEQPDRTPHATWVWSFNGQAQGSSGLHGLSYGLQDNGGWATNTAFEGPNDLVAFWNNYACCDVSENAPTPSYFMSLEGFFSPGRAFRLFSRNTLGGGGNEINYPTAATFASFMSGTEVVRLESNAFAISLNDGVHVTGDITANTIAWTALGAPAGAGASGGIKESGSGNGTNLFFFTGAGNPDGNPGQIFRYAGTAAGGNWNQLPLPPNITGVNVWDVHPTDTNRVVIAGIDPLTQTATMWDTPDFGANWNSIGPLDNLMTANGAFNNQVNEGPTGFTNLATYFQPFMIQFNRRDPTTLIAGAADAGVFLSLDDGANWSLISNPVNPTTASPHIPRPLHAYFGPTRFSADTTSFDVWVATRGAGVQKVMVTGL